MEISKDFEEFFGLLNDHKVRYLVIGGYAVAIHARPRFTDDLDIFVDPESSNAESVLAVLKDFGFGDVGIGLDDLTKADQVIQLGFPPFRIDLLTSISGVSFSEAWDRKVTGRYGKQMVFFIGKQDLIASKKGTGRKRDLEDVDDLM
jgi:predicted nucleotidyltransferase